VTTTHPETPIEGIHSIPRRALGKTQELVPILGLGTAPGGIGMKDDDAIQFYLRAIELGITYIDTAPGYDRAQAQLGEVLPSRRAGLFIASKAHTASYDDALSMVEQNLVDLRIDQLDLVYIHSVGNLDPDEILAKDGSLAGLRKAQSQGLTRFVGITSHHLPAKSARILSNAEVDVGMFALNPGDRHIYNFEEAVLPLARQQSSGIAAMKVYGGAEGMKYELGPGESFRRTAMETNGFSDHERAFRYCLDLPGVAINVIGMYRECEIKQNIRFALDYKPLAATAAAELDSAGAELAESWGEHFGPAKG
jgi:predicted aldo/keto reductase-like oxidoreductase